jgi:DNA/RNA endonuclease G (NUC1)
MRFGIRGAALLALAFLVGSCSDNGGLGPQRLTSSQATALLDGVADVGVRISEFHYDNGGADVGEAIEISGPVGVSLSGWRLVLYNGNPSQRNVYNTINLSGTFPATCGDRGVLVFPAVGLQNGGAPPPAVQEPDGIALVDPTNAVIEFLSYEGSFTPAATVPTVANPAAGLTSTDVGVSQLGNEPAANAAAVQSLWRKGAGTVWSSPDPVLRNTFGACNDKDVTPPSEVVSVTVTPSPATIVKGTTQTFTATALDGANQPISGVTFTWSSSVEAVATVASTGIATGHTSGDTEIRATASNGISGAAQLHIDDAPPPPPPGAIRISELHYDNAGTDADEKIEIEGPVGVSLAGWKLVLYTGSNGGTYNTVSLSGTIQASPGCAGSTGVLVFATAGLQNGGSSTPEPDGVALVDASNAVVEFLSYEGTFTATAPPAAGRASIDIGVSQNGSPTGESLQRDGLTGKWYGPARSSFEQCNPPTPSNFVRIFGRDAGDPPLPVGFETQIFADLIGPDAKEVDTEFTWESLTPAVASIDASSGIVRALDAGTARFRATAKIDGSSSTFSLPTHVATAGSGAQYDNTEFGVPTDGTPGDDIIVPYAQYTASFSASRGTPNWVSFNLEASQFGTQDRCECFTFDPALPANVTRYTTADYVGSMDFYGFQYNRGHLVRSFDRTLGTLDNATTFYFTNIVPQTADNNQGPWSKFEIYLGNIARDQTKEVYVIAGVAGDKGRFLGKDKITIPASLWKVAVIVPRDRGVNDIRTIADLEVIAVDMPNITGILGEKWETYKTTVDAIETASGYDVLAALPDHIEIAVESDTKPPVAALDGPYTGVESSAVAMSGAASTDPDGDALTYAWTFGDGKSATGVSASHTYAQNGTYTVTLTVKDARGLTSVATTTATVANVAPSIASFTGAATVVSGAPFSVAGRFTDPGVNDVWSYTVAWGDGAPAMGGASPTAVISASHTYLRAGSYTVKLTVADRDGGSDESELRVQVVRLAVPAELANDNVQAKENGNKKIVFHVLSTAAFDARSIVVSTARIGTVGIGRPVGNDKSDVSIEDVNGDGRSDLVLQFARSELVRTGAFTEGSTSLVLTADLTDGRQIEARAGVR